MERRSFAVAGAVLILFALVCLPATAVDKAVGSPFYGGKLLVAAPTLTDPNFTETVVFMIDHDASGAFGLIINRVYGSGPIDALLEGFGIEGVERSDEVSLHFGGPVDRARAFVLHSPDYSGPETRRVTDDVALTNRPEVLEAMGRGEGPERGVLLLGYAGWGAGQLENEIKRGDWTSMPADADLIFADDVDQVWDRATRRSGMPL